jgi:hypothetical protein
LIRVGDGMQHKKRSLGFILTILCTFTLLLAACRAGTSSHHTMTQTTTKLNLNATPGAANTMTPGTTTTQPAEYVGQVPSEKAWVGLSTTGKRMVAFVTDGSKDHQPTFAQWFRSSVDNGSVDANAKAKNGSDRLQATLTDKTATGTVTLADGKSIAFTADAVPASDQNAGLFRSEHVVKDQHYVAGWVVLPAAGAPGTATPSATGATTPSANTAITPDATGVATPDATDATPDATGVATPDATGVATPDATGATTPDATGATTPSATGTITPSATGTTTAGTLQQGGAILNEQNYTVLPVPPLTQDQIKSKQISIPNLATFKLVPCQKNLC